MQLSVAVNRKMSFKEFRDLLILLYGDNIVSDEEVLLLYDTFKTKKSEFPHGNCKTVYCFGFVDETVRPISRPDELQRIVYNGHKGVHALKFQSLSLANGLIENLYGPVGEFFWESSYCCF